MKKSILGKRWTILAAGVGVAALAVPVANAYADEESDVTIQTVCGDTMDPDVTGGLAHWEASCSSGNITVSGWVKDTKEDGKCARVKAFIDGKWNYSNSACPEGETENFSFTGPGRSANVYLYVK